MSPIRFLGAGAALLTFLLLGCGREAPLGPVAGGPAPGPDGAAAAPRPPTADDLALEYRLGYSYPLQIGNRWSYAGRTTIRSFEDGAPSRIILDQRMSAETEVLCTQDLHGTPYVVEQSLVTQGSDRFANWIYYRQDRTGLYEADISTSAKPECAPAGIRETEARGAPPALAAASFDGIRDAGHRAAFARAIAVLQQRAAVARRIGRRPMDGEPGGTGEGELTRLRYPLVPGQRWDIRTDPWFGSVDEGLSLMRTPAGWFVVHRVRNLSDLFGSNDRVMTFYSRRGIVGHRYHLEIAVTDSEGNVIGSTTWDDVLELRSLHLVGGPAF